MKSKSLFAALCAATITLTAATTASAQRLPVDTVINPAQSTFSPASAQQPQRPQFDDGSIAGPGTCAKTVLAHDNSTSGNARAPSTAFAASRAVYLITAAELAAAGYTAGASPSTIGWTYQNAGVAGSAPLTVYMENTADTTYLKGTTWATAISTMTVVHTAATALPATAGSFDITLTGAPAFTYTGGGLYVAFDWGPYVGVVGPRTIMCNSAGLPGGLAGANSAAATLGVSAFRPETRLNGVALLNDAAVTQVYSVGALPGCAVPAQVIRAVVVNNGSNALTNLQVTLNITGANTHSDTQSIASLASCGGVSTVTFTSYAPVNLGIDTVTVSVPADTVTSNDSRTRPTTITNSEYSYKYAGSTASGGAGFNGGTGAVVARFPVTVAETITDVKLEFFAISATTYRVAIYPESGVTPGTPGITALYIDAADRTVTAAGPVTITLPAPVAVGPGNFFVGIHQTNVTNSSLSFDNETPPRNGTFFFAAPLPPAAWTDFAPATPFKVNIGYLGTACLGGPVCDADISGDNEVSINDLLEVINNWGTCPPPCPPACPADIDPAPAGDCNININDLLLVINSWGPCP